MRAFDLASFYAQIRATAKERTALRQDLVKGLKDYYESTYGYDKYGAETIFRVPERMGEPFVYGFAVLRILHDRRLSEETKTAAAERALEIIEYGTDAGLPFGLYAVLYYLMERGRLSVGDLRYGLVISAGEQLPFRGMDKSAAVSFFRRLLHRDELPHPERVFWGHSLIARQGDASGAADLINALLGCEALPIEDRRELCQAWINFRQPRIAVDVPQGTGDSRSTFVVEHMPFWVAHMPSWPSLHMVRLGLVWLARLQGNPAELAETFLTHRDSFAEQIHGAVADIIAEHHPSMPAAQVQRLIERGIAMPGSSPTRRRFYRLGSQLFGEEYLQRATEDTANSVRQWAVRQLQKHP